MDRHFAPEAASAVTATMAHRTEDLRALLHLASAAEVPPERMAMLRWDAMPDFLGPRWPEVAISVASLLRTLATAALGGTGAAVRYDEHGLLIVVHEGGRSVAATAVRVLAAARRALFGIHPSPDLVTAWAVVAVEADGLTCRRTAAPTEETTAPRRAARHAIVLADPQFTYLPVWEVRRNIVFFYLCEPTWLLADGTAVSEDAIKDQLEDVRRLAALDVEVLHDAITVVDDILEHDRMAQVLIPVHFQTLVAGEGSGRYAAEIRPASDDLRRRAFLEITGLPADFEAGQLAAMTAGLRSLFRGVLVRVGLDFARFRDLAGCHVFSVGVGLRGENRREAEVIADFDAFMAGAAAASLRTHIHGLHSSSLSIAAVCAGFDLVGSDRIGSALEGCALDDYLIKPSDIYHRLLNKNAADGA